VEAISYVPGINEIATALARLAMTRRDFLRVHQISRLRDYSFLLLCVGLPAEVL